MSVPNSGMIMMLKQFGFDPDVLKKVFTEARDQIEARISSVETSQARIEYKLYLLLAERGIEVPQKGYVNGGGKQLDNGSGGATRQ